eukprot:CAMPEP_0117015676 /NCGR_PEP_ID=MMETSP0472-20121206/12477_1 /TAXON_ID=693140 ORGANISM="Tiarina fusus, Strain LIS" /NCGR_SAMPLE_ID=MMETSP0472 /ASSEMBLY_ACC=CAM_ASM_000603 /LENGTH=504 /DNA_ID=CAMNT_0004719525 /DNA_START=39 /DNA_END=1556 /DNA_ORIENTATION=+
MSYKQNATANRDALFGSSDGSKKKKKGGSSAKTTRNSSSALKETTSNTAPAVSAEVPTSKGYTYGGSKKSAIKPELKGEAKEAKMKEAEDYRDKAKKAMQKGLFSKPDPLAASTYYKRAADAYQLCGESRLERMYRMSSADCQMRIGAFATAAAEYTRAAELLEVAEDEKLEIRREVGRKLHLDAAEAWRSMNEPAKAASSKVQAALALIWGDDSRLLPKSALEAVEEAVEDHVPDPLNPHSRYRQTGISAYVNPNSDETADNPTPEALELARQQIVTRPYAHESVQEVMYLLISFGEYASALYAAGAVTALLSRDGVSTLTLSRSFLAETILTLAMGDPIAAEENFLNRHVQQSAYLTSRECKLAEELFRAVKMRDGEALEEARSPSGTNRAGIGNLHESLRDLVTMIRLSGVARRGAPDTYETKRKEKKAKGGKSSKKNPSSKTRSKSPEKSLDALAAQKTGYEEDVADAEVIDTNALQDELDALDFGDDDSDISDDSLDLR